MPSSSGHGNIPDQHYGITCYPNHHHHHHTVRKLRAARQLDKYTAAGRGRSRLLLPDYVLEVRLLASRGMLYAQTTFYNNFH